MTSLKPRILIIDDSEAIHQDFRRILCPEPQESSSELDALADSLFGTEAASSPRTKEVFEMDSAFQGREGFLKVQEAIASGRPYGLVFLDYRMPPGWNGLETLRHLRKVAPTLQVVLCSAYSDYSWQEMAREYGQGQRLLELRKPFNSQELRELASSLTHCA